MSMQLKILIPPAVLMKTETARLRRGVVTLKEYYAGAFTAGVLRGFREAAKTMRGTR